MNTISSAAYLTHIQLDLNLQQVSPYPETLFVMSHGPNEKDRLLNKLTEIIENNLTNEQFGVHELAREMGMSRSNLHRKLKAIKGISISAYIRQLRLERAMDLLKKGSSTIAEVAFEVGFSSPTYFSKCFHDYFGYPPGRVVEEESGDSIIRTQGKNTNQNANPWFKQRWAIILIPVILILLAAGTTFGFYLNKQSNVKNALNQTLPDLWWETMQVNPCSGEENWHLYQKAAELKMLLRNSLEFSYFWDHITVPLTITTIPDRAKVYAKPYSRPDTTWTYMGDTPLVEHPFPEGLSRIKIEKEGFDTQYDIFLVPIGYSWEADTLHYKLYRPGEKPANMVHAKGFTGNYLRTQGLPELKAGDFWMDKFEVTNRQYKVFMDEGGYTDSSYWLFPFVERDDTITWKMAREQFTDRTGWAGPVNWLMGNYPDGEAELPVTGISWYEAAAYAAFVNKELPSIFHWTYLSEGFAASEIVKSGNFEREGPAEGGHFNSMTRYGIYDMPGNVSEWIFNSSGNKKIIIGGNAKEPSYWYTYRLSISPWTRSELIGFRCMRYIDESSREQLSQSFDLTDRDFDTAEPVSDEVFSLIRDLYTYEKMDLNPEIISRTEEKEWIKETVSLEVPYADLPLKIQVFFPREFKAPYQSVIYFPGVDAGKSISMQDMTGDWRYDFLLRSGRAFVWPVYFSTFGRGTISSQNIHIKRQKLIYRVIDFQITCDYLHSRSEFDQEKIAFYGTSWGGYMAPYLLAIEDRVKLGILTFFGVHTSEEHRELDQINYLPRVQIPMLLMDGRYDYDYTLDQQQAFYDFLGTPGKDKNWKLYESSHYIPPLDLINETTNWLDTYFGPAKR